MLENLVDLVKQHAGDAIVNNPSIPNDSSFDLKGIIGSLSGGKGGFAQELMDKFAGGSDQQGSGLLGKIKGLFGGLPGWC